MDGWMGGWVGGCVDKLEIYVFDKIGWIDTVIDKLLYGWTDGWIVG